MFLDYTFVDVPTTSMLTATPSARMPSTSAVHTLNLTGQCITCSPSGSRRHHPRNRSGSSLSGNLTFRLKYAYAQVNLDDWMWRGSQVRLGMIHTPVVGFEEDIYRYRFQGTVFADREGFLPSADYGAMFRTLIPNGYGEVMTGVYNGDGYTRSDPNDQKAFQVRATVRPLPGPGTQTGLRFTVFYDADHYVQDAERRRFESIVSFDHNT